MEVKIGVAESPRELVVNSEETQETVEALVSEALSSGKGTLALTDDKGRRYIVPAAKVAYVEIGQADARKVGFAVGS